MVWAEETVILGRWFTSHSSALVDPVAGQSVLVSSWLVSLAGAISLRHLPTIEVGLMLLVFAASLLLLILPDSVWGPRWVRCLMALALALVPANPEPYMVLLFAFWWTSLWPLLVLGWRRDHYVIRIAVLIVVGISSLAASCAAPLFLVLWLWRRRRRDLVSALVLLPCLLLQIEVVRTSPRQYPTFDLQTVALQMGRDVAFLFRDSPFGLVPQNDALAAWAFEAYRPSPRMASARCRSGVDVSSTIRTSKSSTAGNSCIMRARSASPSTSLITSAALDSAPA
jgi:hypothetical protein